MRCPRIVIAGAHSGVGKTTVSTALCRSLHRRGLRVQTFKVGPDFLDPTYLSIASEKPCYNLDGWMCGKEYTLELFTRKSVNADISLIEGVMGLFDGASPDTSEGSTAEIARWLGAPVLLIVDAHGMSRSIAPLVKGYSEFDSRVKIAGVIANNSGSERHGIWMREALSSSSLPPLVGAVPRGAFRELPGRHLGLVTADADILSIKTLDALADTLEKFVSVDAILDWAKNAADLNVESAVVEPAISRSAVRLGIARDKAFHFYYEDNLEALESHGCELVPFSPNEDKEIPDDLHGLYIGGGYPEEHVEALSRNVSMLESVRKFAGSGRPVYAECGGMMYLCEGLEIPDGKRYPMAGLLPAWCRMLDRRKTLGYVEVTLAENSLWGVRGDKFRGHEFHYSELIGDPGNDTGWKKVYEMKHLRASGVIPEGYQRGNILASYAHLHLASRPEAVKRFIARCIKTA